MKSALRIALIASSRFPISQPFAGGLEAHVWHLARALAGLGHAVSVFAAPGSDKDLECQTLVVRPLDMSAAARSDASMPAATFMADHHAYLTLMLQLSGSAGDDFDIVHNHSLHYLPVAMASLLSVPMLTTVHTPPTPWLESAIDASVGLKTRFAAVSCHTAAEWFATLGPITVVPNGIDSSRWPLGPGGGPLVWFGRMTAEKAPHLAIAAARQAGRSLVLAGPISDPTYFAAEVAPHIGGEVRYVGHLDQDQLARLVGQSAAALVTPMWDEPYGLVLAEAMCCGTPVVAFNRGGIPEFVAPQAGRLVAPGDTAAMAQAVEQAVQLPRKHVREHALRHCSSEAMVRTYLDLYREMIDAKFKHDRLLHSPSRFRPPGAGHEHCGATEPTGHRVDLPARSRSAPVRRDREATA
ncbi:glycosyltransferase family 4 protein [Mycobacterium sp.]|uniref:glycosyltransferase family 4 protein n=1 Tax=Mycobacterium sp. TaxID=1785 RepID=UPI003D0D54A7